MLGIKGFTVLLTGKYCVVYSIVYCYIMYCDQPNLSISHTILFVPPRAAGSRPLQGTCTLYSIQVSQLYTGQCTVYRRQSKGQCTVYRTVYSLQVIVLHTGQFTGQCTVYRTVYSVQYTVSRTVYCIQDSIHIVTQKSAYFLKIPNLHNNSIEDKIRSNIHKMSNLPFRYTNISPKIP